MSAMRYAWGDAESDLCKWQVVVERNVAGAGWNWAGQCMESGQCRVKFIV